MREIVVVSNTCALVGTTVAADFAFRETPSALMDAFVARYRAAGWTVRDHRPALVHALPSPVAAIRPAA